MLQKGSATGAGFTPHSRSAGKADNMWLLTLNPFSVI
jgi:hypothetical protein